MRIILCVINSVCNSSPPASSRRGRGILAVDVEQVTEIEHTKVMHWIQEVAATLANTPLVEDLPDNYIVGATTDFCWQQTEQVLTLQAQLITGNQVF